MAHAKCTARAAALSERVSERWATKRQVTHKPRAAAAVVQKPHHLSRSSALDILITFIPRNLQP